MGKEIQIFKNEKLNQSLRTVLNDDGTINYSLEDVARAVKGKYVQFKNGKEYIRLSNVNNDLGKFGFPTLNGKGEFIPESAVYLLIMNGENELAVEFQKWLAVEVIPQIRKTGGYIPINEEETEQDILAKALLIAQNTLKRKDELLKSKDKELEEKNRFINQLAASENSLLVREVAKVASKQNIVIGEKRLWAKLREWGLIFLKSTEPKQIGIDKGLFEVNEGTKESKGKVFTYRTTRVTGKGQAYIIERLLKEEV